MKSQKGKLTFFTPRLTAFLLFLSMLLSTVAVFPSSVYAVESEGEPLTEGQENLPLDQTITTEETEFEHFDENSVASASVTSTPVVNNTANTTIVPSQNKVDLPVGNKLIIRIQTTLSNVQSVSVSIDNTAIMTYETISAYQNGQIYVCRYPRRHHGKQ